MSLSMHNEQCTVFNVGLSQEQQGAAGISRPRFFGSGPVGEGRERKAELVVLQNVNILRAKSIQKRAENLFSSVDGYGKINKMGVMGRVCLYISLN